MFDYMLRSCVCAFRLDLFVFGTQMLGATNFSDYEETKDFNQFLLNTYF